MSYDNVIIFGAGASADAGIPLLNNFVDTMWNYSVRGRSPRGELSDEDKKLLAEANQIRIDLERYNSRANFKLRNLEDVLSLLSFEAFAGGDSLKKYQAWVRAITRTVELSTLHPEVDSTLTLEQRLNFIVFDPTLFRDEAANEEMRMRYRECFSPQFQEQITFEPKVEHQFDENEKGKFSHFVQTLKNSRDELLFTP
ncbi:MAG TPA: hypothetical protein VGI63_10585 [Verrucomicrobiae bacterium]|jgi:hypothetical protein